MLFQVYSPGRPVLGWVDNTTLEVFSTLPVCLHYRSSAGEPWVPCAVEERPEGSSFRRRVRTDLGPELFEGEIIEAGSLEEARQLFARAYYVALDKVEGAPAPEAQAGLYGPHGCDSLLNRRAG